MLTLTYLLGSRARGVVKILLTAVTFKEKDGAGRGGEELLHFVLFFLKFYVYISSTCKYVNFFFLSQIGVIRATRIMGCFWLLFTLFHIKNNLVAP